MSLWNSPADALARFASACAGAECGGSPLWRDLREQQILRQGPSAHDAGLLSVTGAQPFGDASTPFDGLEPEQGSPGVPEEEEEDEEEQEESREDWFDMQRRLKEEEEERKKKKAEEARKKKEAEERRRRQAEEAEEERKRRISGGSKRGPWSTAMSAGMFGIAPRGTLVGQSASQFAGTPGFGIAPKGTLVGQSMSTFVGGIGFGLAPAGTSLGSNLPAFVGSSGFGLWGSDQFGNISDYGDEGGAYIQDFDYEFQDRSPDDPPPPPVEPRKVCGPDVTDWLVVETARYSRLALALWRRMPGALVSLTLTLKHIAPQMDYKYRPFRSGKCPTRVEPCVYVKDGRLRGTVTLGGMCIDSSELGNFLFGAFANMLGIPNILTHLGGWRANANKGSKYTSADRNAVQLGAIYGASFFDFLNNPQAPIPIRKLFRDNQTMFRIMQAKGAKECEVCANSRVDIAANSNHVSWPKLAGMNNSQLRKLKIKLPWVFLGR